jgi:hypothetical protein
MIVNFNDSDIEIVEVDKEKAKSLFGNWTVYFYENGELTCRCWWSLVNGHYHTFPEGFDNYFVDVRAL